MKRNIIAGGLASLAAAVAVGSAMMVGPAHAAPAGTTATPVKLADATTCTVTATSTCQVLTPDVSTNKILRQKISAPNILQKWDFIQLTSDPNTNLVLKSNQTISGKPACLDLSSDAVRSQQVSGSALILRKCDATNSQRWTRISFSNGKFELQNKLSLMRLAFNGQHMVQIGPGVSGLRMIKV
ncbi:RICIN domain-containing protein [Kribbella sp. CA-294648]|uniref:RICIN domain-containing protein n=1 Tax=Kribbella sp. CA-294648 TaxID=3239948 RepID=UPI003D8A648D